MAPSSFYHKPELALRRAIELQGIHQEDAALTLLHDVLSSRRHRTWSPIYEQIMICYIDLCLEHHKSRDAKDGLHQYRNLSQSQAPGSLEKVILYLIQKAETACTDAKAYVDAQQLASDNAAAEAAATTAAAAAAAAVVAEAGGVAVVDSNDIVDPSIDDDAAGGGSTFGSGASPEAILLSTMSIDPAKSQRDSALLLPSLKFLWETYRAVLDILRSNSKLEHVYHAAAQGALKFCRVYHRRMEFRHLCEMLRMHLGNLRQFGGGVGSANPEDDLASGKTSNKVCIMHVKVLLLEFEFFPNFVICIHFIRFVDGKDGLQNRLNYTYKHDLHNWKQLVFYIGIWKGSVL
jgi:translation initiation factor 3 subunit A